MKKLNLTCIIDDDPIFVFSAKRTLKLAKISTSLLIYSNGKDAFDNLMAIAEKGKALPDLILLDINMPIWNGWNFLDEFTKYDISKEIIIYIISSSVNPDDQEKAKKYAAVSNFLVKPINADNLEEAILQDFPDIQLDD